MKIDSILSLQEDLSLAHVKVDQVERQAMREHSELLAEAVRVSQVTALFQAQMAEVLLPDASGLDG